MKIFQLKVKKFLSQGARQQNARFLSTAGNSVAQC